MSFIEQVQASSQDLLYLVRGQDRGMDAWHYILLDKLKAPLFLQNIEHESIDISAYGNILYSGWGKHPPQDIVDLIKARYS